MRANYGFLLICALLLGCGPKTPPRYVVESDIDGYAYRRYQQVLDIELPIEGNPAVGYTATYVKGGSTVRVIPVFVTAYETSAGLVDAVRQQLRGMDGYTFDVTDISGDHVWRMRGQSGDLWVLWVSDRYLAKVGCAPGDTEVPDSVVEAYLDRYPSVLDAQGRTGAAPKTAQ